MEFNMVFSDWLTANKITESVQKDFSLSFSEDSIIIPVHDHDGQFSFNKYRRSPLSDAKPKYWYDQGGKTTLYGWFKAKDYDTILLTEGEKDCLVAWSHNIPAVTSTSGAMSFQPEWAELLKDKNVIVCFDNDEPGANGMVKVLEHLPNAKLVFLPSKANMKDISEYVMSGGDLDSLLKTARSFSDIADVSSNLKEREAIFQDTFFHKAYIKAHTKVAPQNVPFKSFTSDKVTRAKEYPITNLMPFKRGKALCPFHNETTPSFTYYPATNSCYCFGCAKVADSIEVYKKLHDVSFKEAVDEINKL